MRFSSLLVGCAALFAACGSTVFAQSGKGFPDLSRWVVEQMPDGKVYVQGDALVIEDAGGCSVWFKDKLTTPVEISYDVKVISAGGRTPYSFSEATSTVSPIRPMRA
jgi:hypothetical protein